MLKRHKYIGEFYENLDIRNLSDIHLTDREESGFKALFQQLENQNSVTTKLQCDGTRIFDAKHSLIFFSRTFQSSLSACSLRQSKWRTFYSRVQSQTLNEFKNAISVNARERQWSVWKCAAVYFTKTWQLQTFYCLKIFV